MSAQATAYLVVLRDDGFGEVILLIPWHCSIGRAPSNCVILEHDLCSREHAA